MDQLTLLAAPATNGSHKQPTVLTADDGCYVSARFRELTPIDAAAGRLLQAVVQFTNVRWVSLVFDQWLRKVTAAAAWTEEEADGHIRADLQRRGLAVSDGYVRLRPIQPAGNKRASVVRSDGGLFSARVRVHVDHEEGETLVRLRLATAEAGFRHAVIDEHGRLIASSSGTTDADAWTRVRNEMARQGYEID
jgi:hypothetical protein